MLLFSLRGSNANMEMLRLFSLAVSLMEATAEMLDHLCHVRSYVRSAKGAAGRRYCICLNSEPVECKANLSACLTI